MTATSPQPTLPRSQPARYAPRGDWSYELLLALLIAAEACVLYLATEALLTGRRGDGGVPPLLLFALLFVGTNAQRALEAGRLWSPTYEIAATAALAVVFIVALRLLSFPHYAIADLGWLREAAQGFILRPTTATRSVWAVTALVAYAWWRGRTRDEPWIEAAYRALRLGTPLCVLALSAAILILPLAGRPLPRTLYLATVGFFGCALAAIALARLRQEQARGTLTLTPRWLATFLGPIAGMLLVGALLAGFFTRRFLDTLLWLLRPLFLVVEFLLLILVYIATGVAWVVFLFAGWIASLFASGQGTPTPPPPRAAATPTAGRFDTVQPIAVADSTRYLIAAALLLAIGFILTRFLYRRRKRRPAVAGETRESIFSWGLLGEGLAGLLRRAGSRLGRRPDPLAELRGDPRWRHTLYIRETYRRLLRRGVEAELPRAPAQTADEYAPAVTRKIHAPPDAVGALTTRYDAARYSDEPATAEDAAAVRAAWEALRRAEG